MVLLSCLQEADGRPLFIVKRPPVVYNPKLTQEQIEEPGKRKINIGIKTPPSDDEELIYASFFLIAANSRLKISQILELLPSKCSDKC